MYSAAEKFYLDDNATAPLRDEVRAKIAEVLRETGNASSVHGFGRRARAKIEVVRESIAARLEATVEGVVFTGSGSEANALVLHDKPRFFCSAGEHASVLAWQPQGENATQDPTQDATQDATQEATQATTTLVPRLVPLLPSGVVDTQALESMLDESIKDDRSSPPPLVSVMAANNETGVVQPIKTIAEICRRRAVLFHCDATQAVGRLTVSLKQWGADMLTLSAHKLGGAQGVGALVCTAEARARLKPLLRGGGQEGGLRAGTENVAAIVGFATALELACQEQTRMRELQVRRDAFELELRARIEGVRVAGCETLRLANTSCFVHPRLSAEVLLMLCDSEGIALSSGAACSSGKVAPSHVLRAMGFDEEACRRAVRVSFGLRTREGALQALLDLLARKEKAASKSEAKTKARAEVAA